MERRYLRIPEAAEYLGLTEGALRTLVARREVPFIKRGRRVFFDRQALDQWMGDGAVVVVGTY